METTTKQVKNEQGSETPKNEISEKIESSETKTAKRYSITLKDIQELRENEELFKAWVKTAEENPEMKAPIIMQFAKAIVKQLKLTI